MAPCRWVLLCLLLLAARCIGAEPSPSRETAALDQLGALNDESAPPQDNFVSPRVRALVNRKPLPSQIKSAKGDAEDFDAGAIPAPPSSAHRTVDIVPGPLTRMDARPVDARRPPDPFLVKTFPHQKRSTYSGDGECFSCHQDKKDNWRRSLYGLVHYDLSIPSERRGCEGCHGPGSAHTEAGDLGTITNPRKLDRRAVSQLCLSCHAEERLIRRQSWHFTDHNESEVTCVDCHSVHHPKADKALRDEPNTMCLKCHREQATFFTLTSHHPVKAEGNDAFRSLRDGKVLCLDCHQVYSARHPHNLRGDKREACLACHPQYRGPFLFEHGGANEATSDGCLTCHLPHGSPNRSLLKRPDRSVCLVCHTDRFDHNNFPGFTCVTSGCHSDIHGSNTSRILIPALSGANSNARGVSVPGVPTPADLLDQTGNAGALPGMP